MKPLNLAILTGLALLGLVGTLIGTQVDPVQTAFSWLTAFAYWCSLALGALFLLLIGHAAGATWVVAMRRLNEIAAASFPVLLLAFVPILFSLELLYPWAREVQAGVPEHVRHLLEHKAPYLNVGFFVARAAIYFAVWILWSELLLRWSNRKVEGEAALRQVRRMRNFGAGGLWPIAFTSTFAAIDWYMSLEPVWLSTMWGVYWFAGGLVSAIALVLVMMWAAERRGGPLVIQLAPSHFYALGRLFFAFVVFWAYIHYFQLHLIWMADLPEEVPFYITRLTSGWGVFSTALALTGFVIPFFILLNKDLKFQPAALAAVAFLVLFAHYLDVAWAILPNLHHGAPAPSWIDVAAFLAIGAPVVLFGLWRLGRLPLLPEHDPRLARAIGYHST